MAIIGDKGLGFLFLLGGAYLVWMSLRQTRLKYKEDVRQYHCTIPPSGMRNQLENSKAFQGACSFNSDRWNNKQSSMF